ncbi:MAG: hypothetical protein ACKO25_06125 [Cyanobium sp.]
MPPRIRQVVLAAAAFSSLLLTPLAARAHGIESNLERLDALSASLATPGKGNGSPAAQIRLDSSFSSGEPVTAAAVRLMSPDGATAIDLGQTDSQGRLTFAVPKQAGAGWELQVDGGPGHRDYLELPAPAAQAGAKAVAQPPGAAGLLPLAREWQQAALGGLAGLAIGGLSLARRR